MATVYWVGATGSQPWSTGANWSTGSAPANGDAVYILSGSSDINSGLSQSAVTVASLTIGNGFTGTIGTASAYLAISATILNIGTPPSDGTLGGGSRRIKIDTGTNATTASVLNSSVASTDSPLPSVCLKGIHASNVLYVLGGLVGVGVLTPLEASTFPTIGVSGGRLQIGGAVLWTTLTQDGTRSNLTVGCGQSTSTLTVLAGACTTTGVFTLQDIIATGGTLALNHRASSGVSATNFTLNGGKVDVGGNPAAINFTNSTLTSGTLKQFSSAQVTLGTVTVSTGGKNQLSLTST